MKTRRVFSLLFAIIFVVSSFSIVSAADSRASAHLNGYNCYFETIGGGDIEICFDVYGTGRMSSIGATEIVLQRSSNGISWTTVKTFTSDEYPEMLASGVSFYLSSVTYDGTAGMRYRADVTVYASNGTTSTSRIVPIDPVIAY